jgi:hypothetical protein
MGKLLIAAGLAMAGYLVHTGQIQIGDRGFRASAGSGGYSSASGNVAGAVVGAAAKIGN